MVVPRAAPVPTVAEVEAIGRVIAPADRNHRITQAYADLSAGFAVRCGDGANWCTFATWASRQAGHTIRGEDLGRAVDAELGGCGEVGAAIARVGDLLRAVGHVVDRSVVIATVRDALSPVRALERAADAVARGNKKVFDEIGREFARFLPVLAPGGAGDVERFCAALRPGPPPDGQDLLRAAFAGYARAIAAGDRRVRAEQLLLANLRVALHEQTRLQAEITEALDAPIASPREVKERLLARLGQGPGARLAARLADRADDDGPLDHAIERLVDAVRRQVRRILTEHLTTLDLPSGPIRLGADVGGACPPDLRAPADAELCELLGRIDPVPGTTLDSGAEDWADLAQRMHFISELFRNRQTDRSLFDPPFATR